MVSDTTRRSQENNCPLVAHRMSAQCLCKGDPARNSWSRSKVIIKMKRGDLNPAIETIQRRREHPQAASVIHHSDQGCQYTSFAFGKRCRLMGVRPSMGSVGDCYDNAMAESFFATLECELIDRHSFKTQAEAKMAIFEFIEGWYNPHRRHSSLGQQSPLNYENNYQQAA